MQTPIAELRIREYRYRCAQMRCLLASVSRASTSRVASANHVVRSGPVSTKRWLKMSYVAFGPRLRAHRERRGLTLEAVANSIKIHPALLADLERNDVSRWPPGIYRRALARQYLQTIGLSPDDFHRDEFRELFSEPGDAHRTTARTADHETQELRLAFAAEVTHTPRLICARVCEAAVSLSVVLALGCMIALISGSPYWTGSGIVALIWYPATGVAFGDQAVRRMLSARRLSNSPFPWRPHLPAPTKHLIRTIVARTFGARWSPVAIESHAPVLLGVRSVPEGIGHAAIAPVAGAAATVSTHLNT
jgi:transcriptional regulator with XRE-family HTH domain